MVWCSGQFLNERSFPGPAQGPGTCLHYNSTPKTPPPPAVRCRAALTDPLMQVAQTLLNVRRRPFVMFARYNKQSGRRCYDCSDVSGTGPITGGERPSQNRAGRCAGARWCHCVRRVRVAGETGDSRTAGAASRPARPRGVRGEPQLERVATPRADRCHTVTPGRV